MELSLTQGDNHALITIMGDIDEKGAEEMKARFRSLNLKNIKEVSFDFQKVGYVGSAAIGKLLLFYKDMALNEGEIRITNVPQATYDLLMLLKLDALFTITKG